MADRLRRAQAGLGTVRFRTTVAATLIVGVTLVLGGVLLVVTLRAALERGVARSVRQQADAAAAVLATGETPGILGSDDDDVVAQLLDGRGRVVAASPGLDAEAGPLVPGLEVGRTTTFELPGRDERFLATAVSAATPEGPRTVVVADTLEVAEQSSGTVIGLLLVGLPVLVALVAVITWRVTGRALAPVERIRAAADAVSATDLGHRVPAPAGNDEIARLAATMNNMLGRLEQSQNRQRRFVSDASHELRSPIATIRQHAEVASGHPEVTTPDALAVVVLAETLRLQHLVDDLLVLARTDEGAVRLRRRPLDLDRIVLDEARRIRTMIDHVVDATAVSAGAVDGDLDALRRVVRNVVENAARHAEHRVSLSLSEQEGTVTFAVEDDGPGVAPPDRGRAFERFVRLDGARTRSGHDGSGLGLAIVAELVALHEGRVALADAALGGTRIEIRLPGHR